MSFSRQETPEPLALRTKESARSLPVTVEAVLGSMQGGRTEIPREACFMQRKKEMMRVTIRIDLGQRISRFVINEHADDEVSMSDEGPTFCSSMPSPTATEVVSKPLILKMLGDHSCFVEDNE